MRILYDSASPGKQNPHFGRLDAHTEADSAWWTAETARPGRHDYEIVDRRCGDCGRWIGDDGCVWSTDQLASCFPCRLNDLPHSHQKTELPR